MSKIINAVKHPVRILLYCSRRGWLKWLPDSLYLKIVFKARLGKKLNLDNPQTFNEKMQWLKLNDRKPEYTQMVDKYEAKTYVSGLIGEEYIIPTLGVWDNVDEIDFSSLPNQFVLKCTHDSGGIVICKDKSKLDVKAVKKKLSYCQKNNGYNFGREWPYKHVKPRIIAEQYMEDSANKGDLTDYKLHFFSGECKAIMVGQNRFGANGLENDYYTADWEHYNFTRGTSHNASEPSPKPVLLDEMIRLGKILAKDYPFVRIDFYIIDNRIYFGEITFFPASGFNPFHPEEWDYKFGSWIKLPEASEKEI